MSGNQHNNIINDAETNAKRNRANKIIKLLQFVQVEMQKTSFNLCNFINTAYFYD